MMMKADARGGIESRDRKEIDQIPLPCYYINS